MMAQFLLRLLPVFIFISLLMLSWAVADDSDDEVVDGEVEDEELGEGEDEPDIQGMTVDGQTIQFGIPEVDDEFHAMHIPDDFKCDACKILAKQFTTAFDKANAKRPSLKKNLPEYDVIDILEEQCEDKFTHVGVKEVDGLPRLSGPGMDIQEATGIMQGGGKWPMRMKALCLDIIGEIDEDEIYRLYKEGKLESHLCLAKYRKSRCVMKGKDGMVRVEL